VSETAQQNGQARAVPTEEIANKPAAASAKYRNMERIICVSLFRKLQINLSDLGHCRLLITECRLPMDKS
jgi:hypothetical protein